MSNCLGLGCLWKTSDIELQHIYKQTLRKIQNIKKPNYTKADNKIALNSSLSKWFFCAVKNECNGS